MRIFLDTNVLVSAFATRGLCAEVLEVVLLDHDLIIGRSVLRELDKALREKVKLSDARAGELVDFILGEAAAVIDKTESAGLAIDADDALVLGEAIAGHTELFVTGDAALLRVTTAGIIKIISPRQLWEMLMSQVGSVAGSACWPR